MLKLTKYEFRKNLTAPIILLIVIGILELLFLVSVAIGKEDYIALAFGIQMLPLIFSYFIVLILSISSYSRELRSKSSYMTFMAPVSTYKIVGSKLLSSLLTAILFAAILFIVLPLNVTIIGIRYNEIDNFFDMVDVFMQAFDYSIAELLLNVIMIAVEIMISFYLIVVLAYLAITLSSTVFQDKKFKGFFSAIIFAVLYGIASYIAVNIPETMEPTSLVEAFVATLPVMLFYLVCIVSGFFATGALLDKKVSL